MDDHSFENDFSEHYSSEASNTIINSTDLRTNYSSTSQMQDYLDILSTSANNIPTDDANAKEISNNLSSEKIDKPKFWSISDILGNSSDACSNETSSSPAGEICEEPNYVPALPVYSNIENQVITNNGTMNFSNINSDANNFIDNQSQLNMSTVNLDLAAMESVMAKLESQIFTFREKDACINHGMENFLLKGYNICQYTCGVCYLSFDSEKEMYHHQFKRHVLDKNLCRCRFCGENYGSYPSLQQHVKEQHLNMCFFCHIQFGNQILLVYHVIVRHPNGI